MGIPTHFSRMWLNTPSVVSMPATIAPLTVVIPPMYAKAMTASPFAIPKLTGSTEPKLYA